VSNKEVGRLVYNNLTLIEYEEPEEKSSFFIQSGVVGFYATDEELYDLYSLLSYYYNMDTANEVVINLK
jgi:hypothetical protein